MIDCNKYTPMIQHVIADELIGKKNKYWIAMRPGFKFGFCHLPAAKLNQSGTPQDTCGLNKRFNKRTRF